MIKIGSARSALTGAMALAATAYFFGCAPTVKPQIATHLPPGPPSVYIEVNIPAMEMTVYEDGFPKFVKPIAIGSGIYPTPAQEAEIKKIEWNPWWYPPPADWAKNDKPTPPGPKNPLGLVKMPLSNAILFHGTNKEKSVGTPASHGCMRMLNADAIEVAWYLQSRFSEKNDPSFLESYSKNRKKTFVVHLTHPVPAGLIYKPAILKGDSIAFYPDYYKKLIRKEAAVTEEILASGADEDCIDREKVRDTVKSWPKKGAVIQVRQFLLEHCK